MILPEIEENSGLIVEKDGEYYILIRIEDLFKIIKSMEKTE